MMASALLFAAAVLAAGYHHHQRSGRPAIGFLVLMVAGSGTFFALLGGRAEMSFVALAAIVCALALAFEREPRADGSPASDTYGDDREYVIAVRWAAAGVLIGAASWVHPAYLLFFLPLGERARHERRIAPVWVGVGGALPWLVALWRGSLGAGWQDLRAPAHLLDPALTGWNLLYLAAGRNVGLVVWFLPALLLAACYRRGSGRGWLLTAIVIATLALPLLAPHNFWGGPGGGGNLWFLPLYGALWLVPVSLPRTHWVLLFVLAAGLFLWPAWAAPRAAAAEPGVPASDWRSLASRLPYETTQRHLPSAAEWQGTGVWSRSLTDGLQDGEAGPQLVPAEGPAELLIAAERPLESVLLDFGPRSGSELEVEGGRTGETLFKPDGGVRFEVELDGVLRKHPMSDPNGRSPWRSWPGHSMPYRGLSTHERTLTTELDSRPSAATRVTSADPPAALRGASSGGSRTALRGRWRALGSAHQAQRRSATSPGPVRLSRWWAGAGRRRLAGRCARDPGRDRHSER
jgi:hypothetical protein